MKQFMPSASRGFTLTELLVVIAILSVLATVTLTMVQSTRVKANDTTIRTSLASIQIKAEVYYTLNKSYGNGVTTGHPSSCVGALGTGANAATLFGGDTVIKANLQAIKNIVGTAEGSMQCSSHVYDAINRTGPDYTIFVKLSTGEYWCVDSHHFAGIADFTGDIEPRSCV